MSSLIIFGAGGQGKVVAETARLTGEWSDIVFADDLYPQLDNVNDIPVLANFSNARQKRDQFPCAVVAMGNNSQRFQLVQSLQESGFDLPKIIHPAAIISASAKIESASVVCANAVIQSNATVGTASIINTSASVDHDCRIGDAVHLSPGTHLGGDVHIGNFSFLGVGVSVIRGVKIGSNCIIGAGAAVIGDINDDSTAVGVPAKLIKKIN